MGKVFVKFGFELKHNNQWPVTTRQTESSTPKVENSCHASSETGISVLDLYLPVGFSHKAQEMGRQRRPPDSRYTAKW